MMTGRMTSGRNRVRVRSVLMAIVLGLGLFGAIGSAYAIRPGEILDDPKLEARAREISKGLRCLVCQNQSIDDSEADLAHDLRMVVRERLLAGDSNKQVVDYVVARYGDYVLLDPPVKADTIILWAAPGIAVVVGAFAVFFWYRGRARAPHPEEEGLAPEEEARLAALLREGDANANSDEGQKGS